MMASIGQLAAGVAHEINNPLGYVGSNLSTLRNYAKGMIDIVAAYDDATAGLVEFQAVRAGVDAAKAQCDLGFIRDELPQLLTDTQEGIARIKRIVKDLKDFSHVDESDWQPCNLNCGIESTLNLLANELATKATVVRDFGSIAMVEGQAFQLNQVFLNLLRNALQAIAERGQIAVRTRQEGEWVIAEVSDDGDGVAPEHRDRIFDPFFTTRPVGQGAGLGLSLAYSVVKKHGGCIDVESEPGNGALFRVRLPVSRAA
jgi:signal transduction histidine kinase